MKQYNLILLSTRFYLFISISFIEKIKMVFKNQRLLLILAKIEGQKDEVIDPSKLTILVNMLRCLCFVYFMMINAGSYQNNILVISAQTFNQYFSQGYSLQLVLSIVLLVLHLLFLSSLIFLIFQSQKLLLQHEMRRNQQIIKLSAFIETIISTIGNTIAALLISVMSLKALQLNHYSLINLVAVLLSILKCYIIQNALFSYIFFFILAIYNISAVFGNTILLMASLYISYTYKKMTLVLKLINTMAISFIAAQLLQCDIKTYQILSTFLLVVIIDYIEPQQSIFSICEVENDFLISIAEKLFDQIKLSTAEKIKISFIFQKDKQQQQNQKGVTLYAKWKNIDQKLSEFDLFLQLLLQKINKDICLNPLNNTFKLQQIGCYLVSNKISLQILKKFHEIRSNIMNNSNPQQIKRLEVIINKVEKVLFKNSKEINCLLIMAVEREVQRFYRCLGYSIEGMLIFWRMLAKNQADQVKLESSLDKVIESQRQSLGVIETLKTQKNLSIEVKMINYFHEIINLNSQPLISDYIPEIEIKIVNTSFILISNNKIQQISLKLSKQLCIQKQLVIDNEINIIFPNSISSFLLQQMDRLALDPSQDSIISIPFNIYNSNYKFHVFRCQFQLIPDLSKGIQYLIHVADQQQSNLSYVLYNLRNDKVLGATANIFTNHKISQIIDLSNIYAQELFNIYIPDHLSKDSEGGYHQIGCHLMLFNLMKKSNNKQIRQNQQPQIVLKVRQQYQLKSSSYLLLQISQEYSVIRGSQRGATFLNFLDKQNENSITIKESTKRQQINYFCRINNPLTSLVDEKLSRMNSSFRISYYQIIIWLFSFGILLFICSLISMIFTSKSTTITLSSQFNHINMANDLRYNLYDIFQQLYQLHQINEDPEFFTKNLNNLDITIQKQLIKERINSLIQECIISIYLNRMAIQQINVELIFSNYIASTNVDPFTIINLLSQIKKSLVEQDIKILNQNSVQTYKIINSYITPLAISFDQFSSIIKYMMIVYFLLWGLKILAFYYIFIKIQIFKRKIFQIYSVVTIQERNQYVKNLQQFLLYLLQTNYNIRNISDRVFSSGFTEKQLKPTKSEKEAQSIKQNDDDNNQSNDKGDIKKNEMSYSLVKINIICLIPIILCLYQIMLYLVVEDYRLMINYVLQHNQRINNLVESVKYSKMSYFQLSSYEQANSSHVDSKNTSHIQQLISINNKLPEFFDQYQKIQEKAFNTGICSSIKYEEILFFEQINCSKVLQGALNSSLSSAYSLFIHKLMRTKLNFQMDNYDHISYPFLIEVIYSGYYIEKNIKDFQILFRQTSHSYFTYIGKNIQNYIALGFLILSLVLIIILIIFRRVSKICILAFKFFTVIPRQSITKLSTSKKLMNMGILDEIGLIAI